MLRPVLGIFWFFRVWHSKSMNWFLYDRNLRYERLKVFLIFHSKLEFLWYRSYDSHGFNVRIKNNEDEVMKFKWLFWNSSKLTLLQLQVDQKHGLYVMVGQIHQRSDSSKFVVEKYFGIWPRFYIIKTNFSQVRSRICVFASTLWNILRNMIVLTKAF